MRLVRVLMLLLTVCLAVPSAVCQRAVPQDDLQLLREVEHVDHRYDDRRVTYGFTPGRRTVSPVYHALSAAMYFYQSSVSPVLQRSCAFVPSCSAYSKALLQRYGLLKGTVCTADRLMRCNRMALADRSAMIKLNDGHGHIVESVERYK